MERKVLIFCHTTDKNLNSECLSNFGDKYVIFTGRMHKKAKKVRFEQTEIYFARERMET